MMKVHATWGPCHHDMVRPRNADAGDGPNTWRIVV